MTAPGAPAVFACHACKEIARRVRPAELAIVGGDATAFGGQAIGVCQPCLDAFGPVFRLAGAVVAVAQLDTPAAQAAVDRLVSEAVAEQAHAVHDAEAFVAELERVREGGRDV